MNNSTKKIFFIFITLLIPIFFFILIEGILHLTGIASHERLILTTEINSEKYYQLNKDVGKRYFSKTEENLIPQLFPQTFEYEKSPQTFRIFLLGGSTMAGFPYELNARINSLLQDRLSTYYPDKNIEVINTGLSAVNSFTVMDFVRELMEYEPDLFIIYMGHNEFYGAYGVASLETFGKNPWVIRTYLKLKKLRTFQLVRKFIQGIARYTHKSEKKTGTRTLMESMVKNKSVPLNSHDYNLAKRYYNENLNKIISTIKKNNYPVILSTLFSNLRGQEPFISLFADSLDSSSKEEWEINFERGKNALSSGKSDSAFSYFSKCLSIDTHPAKLHFQLGNYYLKINDTLRAFNEFKFAKDLDGLRFRAPSDFNSILKKASVSNQIPLVDLEESFHHQSFFSITGNELITEHLHPTFDGYFLMAKYFSEYIVERDFINAEAQKTSLSDDFFQALSGVTIFDRAIGDMQIKNLTSRWPYKKPVSIISYTDSTLKRIVESLVNEYLHNNISWNQGHYQLAQYFSSQGKHELAIREFLAVVKIVPDNYFPFFKIGNIYFTQNKLSEAEHWFLQALRRSDRSFIHAKLAMVYLAANKLSAAKKEFLATLEMDRKNPQLSKKEKIAANFYLAICLIKMKHSSDAKHYLQQVINIDPKHPEANQLLSMIQSGKEIDIQL